LCFFPSRAIVDGQALVISNQVQVHNGGKFGWKNS